MVDLLSTLDHFQNGILVPKNKIRSKESETEQKHNAVLQELEDDYEKRLADKARQLEDKVKIWTKKCQNKKIMTFLMQSSLSANSIFWSWFPRVKNHEEHRKNIKKSVARLKKMSIERFWASRISMKENLNKNSIPICV